MIYVFYLVIDIRGKRQELTDVEGEVMSTNKGKNKAAKAGISYIIGNYCIKGIGIISAPVFARLLTTEDYGIYNTFTAYEGIIYILICLALHASLKNAYIRFENKIDEYTSSIAVIPFLIYIASTVGLLVFNKYITKVTGLSCVLLVLVLLYSYCSGVIILYRHRIALEYRSKEYLIMSFLNVLGNFLISLVLILTVFSETRYLGRVIGGVISYAVIALYILIQLRKRAKFSYNREYWRYGLKISLPLIPHGLAQVFLLQFDRIMINSMCGSADAGIYSFSYTLYSLIQITGNSLSTAFEPWGFQKLKNKDIVSVKRVGTSYILVLAGIVTVCMLFSPEIILIVGSSKYSNSVYTSIPILLSGFFSMAYTVPALVEFYSEKTHYISIGTSIAAVVNVILNTFFIKKYGYIAAAYTTLFSYILYFIMHIIISKKIIGKYIIDMKILSITVMILLIGAVCGLCFIKALFIRFCVCVTLVIIGLLLLQKCYGLKNIKMLVQRRG